MGLNISELVQSSRYKNFMKYLYGWGASIVLVGALFKLQHWTGAGIMLTVGMLTEAVIFFFSAFEPIVEEVDWSIVYPELAGVTDERGLSRGSQGGGMDPLMLENVITSALSKSNLNVNAVGSFGGNQPQAIPQQPQPTQPAPVAAPAGSAAAFVFTEKFNDMLEKAKIGPELFMQIGTGLERLSTASNGIANISQAVAAGQTFSNNLNRAGSAVGKFAESYENSGQLMSRSAQVLTTSISNVASGVETAGKGFATSLQEMVQQMSSKLNAASESVSGSVTESGKQLQGLTKNIEALNAAHELQVKKVQESLKDTDVLSAGVQDMIKRLSKTVEDSQKYGQSVSELTSNVSKLNAIYGNMLSAMGSVLGK